MEVILKEEKKLFSDAGICFLEAVCTLPELSGGKRTGRTNRFYADLRAAFFACAEACARTEKERYESSTDPRRRFTHRPLRFSLRTRLSEPDDTGLFPAVRLLTLTHKGKCLYEKESRESIGRDGELHPPSDARRKRPSTKKRPATADSATAAKEQSAQRLRPARTAKITTTEKDGGKHRTPSGSRPYTGERKT